MESITAFTLLWIVLGITSSTIGEVSVDCGKRFIRVKIEDYLDLLRKLDAEYFFVGDGNQEFSSRCLANGYGEMNICLSFLTCGGRTELFGDGAVYTSSVWAVTSNRSVIKYADVTCKYGTRFGVTRPPQRISLQARTEDDFLLNVSLCRTPIYCPSGVCSAEESFSNHVIYFERDVMTLRISLKRQNTVESSQGDGVAAINRLTVKCGSDPDHNLRTFYSVEDGCKARKPFVRSLRTKKQTLGTAVDFNVQSDTVCMSVDTPLSKDCPVFYIHGIVIYCNRSFEKKCDDYSGSRCVSPDAERSEFVYGPVYVVPRNLSLPEVKYYTRDRNAIMALPETISLLEKRQDLDRKLDQLEVSRTTELKSDAEWERDKISRLKEEDEAQNYVAGRNLAKKAEGQTKVGPKKNDLVAGRSFVAEAEQKDRRQQENYLLQSKLVIPEDVLQKSEEEVFRGDSSKELSSPRSETDSGEKDFLQSTEEDVFHGELSKGPASTRLKMEEGEGSGANLDVEVHSPAQSRGVFSQNPNSTEKEPNTIASNFVVLDNFDPNRGAVALENQTGSLLEAVDNEELPTESSVVIQPKESRVFGKFNATGANQGFIWASVCSLGLFAVVAIGLLAAWIGTKRKKARQQW